jgi:hypothetical protein
MEPKWCEDSGLWSLKRWELWALDSEDVRFWGPVAWESLDCRALDPEVTHTLGPLSLKSRGLWGRMVVSWVWGFWWCRSSHLYSTGSRVYNTRHFTLYSRKKDWVFWGPWAWSLGKKLIIVLLEGGAEWCTRSCVVMCIVHWSVSATSCFTEGHTPPYLLLN